MERKSVIEMWQEAASRIEVLSPKEFAQEDVESDQILLLDVREPMERGEHTIPGARHVPRGILEWWACPSSPFYREDGPFGDFDRRVVAFCSAGGNGTLSAATLKDLGYLEVATIEGGFSAWSQAGLSTEPIDE